MGRAPIAIVVLAAIVMITGCSEEPEVTPIADAIGEASGDDAPVRCCPIEFPRCDQRAYAGGVDRGTGCFEHCNVSGEGSQLVTVDGCQMVKLARERPSCFRERRGDGKTASATRAAAELLAARSTLADLPAAADRETATVTQHDR